MEGGGTVQIRKLMGISQHLIRVTNTFSHFIHGHYSKQVLAKIFLPRMHSILQATASCIREAQRSKP
jgi:hypothetical protein